MFAFVGAWGWFSCPAAGIVTIRSLVADGFELVRIHFARKDHESI